MTHTLVADRGIEPKKLLPLPRLQRPTVGPPRKINECVELTRDSRQQLFLEILGSIAEVSALALEVGKQLLRLILGHEANEEWQLLVLGHGELGDKCSSAQRRSRWLF